MENINKSKDITQVMFSIEDISPITADKKTILNIISHIHFSRSWLFLYFTDQTTGRKFFIKATPETLEESGIVLRYSNSSSKDFASMHLEGIVVEEGQRMLMIPVLHENITNNSVKVLLLENIGAWNKRSAKRHQCTGIIVKIETDTFHLHGSLTNFSAKGFCVCFNEKINPFRYTLPPSSPVVTTFYKEDNIFFRGSCEVIRLYPSTDNHFMILKNSSDTCRQYKARAFRNPRHKLVPTPKIVLRHPILNTKLHFEIFDISTSGFSICVPPDEGLFMPGMIFQEASIFFLANYKLNCSAQVIYTSSQNQHLLKLGFVFLDMEINDYGQLFSALCNAYDQHINFTASIDTESLWAFFFSSGFIYENKYRHIMRFNKDLKTIYRRLYKKASGVFRCITYQRNGKIFGHVSMIKAYPGIWMVHHLAAVPMDGKHVGRHILHQIINYLEGPFRLPSSDMDFLMFYYRPENKFPEFFFTTACTAINNAKICSIDLFDYFSCALSQQYAMLPNNWTLDEISNNDLEELIAYYETESGGLLMDALSMSLQKSKQDPIDEEFCRYNLKRSFSIHVLKHDESLRAAFVVDESDVGINLSELLNSIKIIIHDSEDLEWDILYRSLCILGSDFKRKTIPIIVYPSGHRCMDSVVKEKRYRLLIINKINGIDYLDQLKKIGNFM